MKKTHTGKVELKTPSKVYEDLKVVDFTRKDGEVCLYVPTKEKLSFSEANKLAQLFEEVIEVGDETNQTPKELVEENKMLKRALTNIMNAMYEDKPDHMKVIDAKIISREALPNKIY